MANTPRLIYRKPMGPCKDCPDRCVNCHASCQKYISWKKECDRIHKEVLSALQKERAVEERAIKGTKKYNKRKVMR